MSSGQRNAPAAATTETNPQVNNKLFVPHRATRHEPQPAPRLERQGPWQRLGPRRARQVAQLSVAPPIAVPPQQAPPAPKRPHRAAPAPRLAPTPRTQRIQRLPARVGGWRRGRGCRRGSRSRPPQGRRPHRRPGGRPSTPIATSQRPRQTAPGLSKRPSVCNPRRMRPPECKLVHRTEVSEGRQDWGGPAAPVRPAAEAELAAGALECGCRDSYGGGGLLKGGIGEGGAQRAHKVAAGISRSLCTDTAVHRDKADIDFADVVVGCLHLWHTHNPVNAVTVFTSIQHNKQPSGQAGVEDGTEQETIRRLACPDAITRKAAS